jgi:integrase
MTSINFTKTALENLPPKTKSYQVSDLKTPGLNVRVNPGGLKSYILYRRLDGKMVRIPIGRVADISLEQARNQAVFLNSQILSGIRPNEVLREKRKELTLQNLFDIYYRQHLLIHTKRPKDNKAMFERSVMPHLGRLKLSQITRRIMKDLHLSIANSKSGKLQSNRVLNMTSALFNYAIKEELYDGRNPCTGIRRFKSKSRDRFLSKEELEKFFDALTWEEQIFQDFFMLTLFIGARKHTMLSMRYKDIDLTLARWRLSEDETKNGEVNVYTLSDAALNILKRRALRNEALADPSEFVFPGSGAVGHLADPKKSFGRIKRRMGVYDIRIHDLRRTLASYMAINNCSLPIIGMALNHKSRSSTEIYARLSQDPVRDALNAANTVMLTKPKKQNLLPSVGYNFCPINVSILVRKD